MESILGKFEKDSVSLSQIYGGVQEIMSTGRGFYGSSQGMTEMGSEFSIFDGECFHRFFQSDNGGGRIYLDTMC